MTAGLCSYFEAEAAPLKALFTCIMLLDRELRVRYASETLTSYMPELGAEPRLAEAFTLLRPRSVDNYDDALGHDRALYLLTASSGQFALRGQLLPSSYGGHDCLVFCGSPWLSWMVNNQPGIKLQLQDFAPQDVQLDQLFYMSTETRMVADLEQLNAKLKVAKVETEAAQASKEKFFARMSHEMRTPLNGVVSALALMGDEPLTGKPRELLDLASASSSNLMEVINYVLDVSRLESNDSPPEDLAFDLRELVGSVNDVVRARALEKGLDLSSRCAATLPRCYIGDANRLRQALLNLVINAIKFTDAGSVTIDVEAVGGQNGEIRFEVQDTGRGIPRNEQASIFEPFTRLSGSAEAGTGLGLDIARRNVYSMGGRIGVSSAPDVGSTFWIELPLRVAEEEPATSEPDAAADTAAATNRFTGDVLLVDDNETNLMLGTMILERMGVSVSQAASGESAVQMALAGNYDAVLMDISMPGIDGYEATRRIRKKLDAGALPIIALTAYASSVELEQSVACGMNAYLTKPIDREQLAEALAEWMKGAGSTGPDTGPPGGGDGDPGLVDPMVLTELKKQIGLDNLAAVIDKFTEEAGHRWLALERAADNRDVAREAHTLASTCRSFGLPSVADRLKLIEAHANDQTGESPFDLSQTGSELRAGLLELEALIARLRAD